MSKKNPIEFKTDIDDKPSTKTVSSDLGSQMDEGMSLCIMSKHVSVCKMVGANTNYFSSPLKTQVLISKDGKIPNTMFDCIQQLQMRGIEMEGIFRIPGTHSKIQETRKLLEAGEEVNFSEIDIMTVASILKLWLRELPTPLIPFRCYFQLVALGATVEKLTKEEKLAWMDKVKRIIVTILSPEWECLRYLMIFLHKVAINSEVNKMPTKNLAIVMAPNIMYMEPEEDDDKNALAQIMLKDNGPTIEIITILIEEMEFFFWEKDMDEE